MEVNTPRIVIAGTRSGDGKTTIAAGIMAAFRKRGLKVQGFKVGPDYIDPTYHFAATGLPPYNLDGWMTGESYLVERFASACRGKDLAVIEGVMGLFDGRAASPQEGSTAQVAKLIGAPVALVIDASGLAASAAALAQGYCRFDPELDVAAVIFNRVGRPSHLEILREAVASSVNAKVLGGLPRDEAVSLPSRHLGLFSAGEASSPGGAVDRIGASVEESLDLDLLLEIAKGCRPLNAESEPGKLQAGERCRVAYARDEAFYFYYQDNLELMEEAGAELAPFSPLRDEGLPPGARGVYIGGGYPELFAEGLERNEPLRRALKKFAEAGGAIYAECGGLMYLLEGIETVDGESWAMVGVLPGVARMCGRRKALGYVEVQLSRDNILGSAGSVFRGHEFHYSELAGSPGEDGRVRLTYTVRKGDKALAEGYSVGNVLASYVHAHFGSNADLARNFMESCRRASPRRG